MRHDEMGHDEMRHDEMGHGRDRLAYRIIWLVGLGLQRA